AQAEVGRAVAHVEGALRRIPAHDAALGGGGAEASVRYRPLRTVGRSTPWNTPVAIPVGKIAPALAFGNAVVWKPACRAPRAAMAILTALLEAGLPGDLVNLVFGEDDTAPHLSADCARDAGSRAR